MKIEINLSDHYGKDVVLLLSKFSKYTNNKSFEDLTREDIWHSSIVLSNQKNLILYTNGLEHTTSTEGICKDSSNGYTIRILNPPKDRNQMLSKICPN